MSWLDERRPASYRDLEFEAIELGVTGGNRLVVDEFPESDDHTVGELGNKATRFKLRGWVQGDDYLDQLGNLEAAFRKHGAAELVHPWRGRYTGFVEDYEITHDISGGLGEFEISFVVAGLETSPVAVTVTETDVIEKGATASAAATSAAESSIYDDLPSYYRTTLDLLLAAEASDFDRALGITTDLTASTSPTETIALITAAIAEATNLVGLVRYLSRSESHLPVSSGTATEDDLVDTAATYVTAIRSAVLSRASAIAIATSYLSANAAEDTQTQLVALIDTELDTEPADATFTALSDLRASLIEGLSSIADRLPRERTIRRNDPMPAMILAFDLYGDVDREGQVLALNGGGHPGFLSGDLTVLSSTEEQSR